jgi:hypothetical protein
MGGHRGVVKVLLDYKANIAATDEVKMGEG